MDLIYETYAIASRLLGNEISLTEFEKAFVPLVPYFVEHPVPTEATDLVRAIDEALVDFGIGEATETDVREAVRRLGAEAPLILYVGEPRYEAGSDVPTYTREFSFGMPGDPIIQIGRPEFLGRTSSGTQLAEAHG